LPVAGRTACSWSFWPEWYAPGSKHTSLLQPETLLLWHRQGFRLFWNYKSRAISATPKISAETIGFIKEMARDNRLWGAQQIRGELLKLGILSGAQAVFPKCDEGREFFATQPFYLQKDFLCQALEASD
jgi:hypothetical protein